jgi:hypothetical protein
MGVYVFFSVFCHKLMVGVVGSHTFFCSGDSTGPAYLEATKQRITTTRATGMARTTNNENKSQPGTKTNQAKQVPCARSD